MTPRRARLRSPAKINLDLRVLHRRPDGFHELRSIFHTISLYDTLDLEYTPGRRFSLALESNVEIPGENIVARAAALLREETGLAGQWTVRLTKRIPMGSGLGGGSSNAAAILLAMPVLAGKRIALPRLIALATALGSDVPFFLLGGAAAALGRGTELYPLPPLPPAPGILSAPPIHVSTAEAYLRLRRTLTSSPPSSILNSFQGSVWRVDECAKTEDWDAVNDFEATVFLQHPELRKWRDRLRRLGARPARMSGSGSAVFGLFADCEKRDEALSRLKKDFGDFLFPISLLGRAAYRSLWHRQLHPHCRPRTDEGMTWPPRSRYGP